MPTRAHRSPSSLATWRDGDDNDDEAEWPGIAEALRVSLEESGLASTSAPLGMPSDPPNVIEPSATPVPRQNRRDEGSNAFATSDLWTALEQPPEFQPRRSILRNTSQASSSSSQQTTHNRHETVPPSLPSFGHDYVPRPVAPQPRPHDSWYSHLQSGTPVPAYSNTMYAQMLPTPSPSHPPSAPYLAPSDLAWSETPSAAFPMTLNTTEVDDGWSTVDPAYDMHAPSVLFPTTQEPAYAPGVYSAAQIQIDATGLPLFPSRRPASDDPPAIRPRRRSTPRAMQPQIMGRDLVTGQPMLYAVDLGTTAQMDSTVVVDNPDEWRQVHAKELVCENVCALCRSRLIPLRFSIKWPPPDSIRRTQLEPGALSTPPMDIEQSLVAECMSCSKIHCRGCWQGEYRKPSNPFPAGCLRADSCVPRRGIAVFEARSFDEHYLRFCGGETRAEPGLVSNTKAGRYLALQPGYAPAIISTGLAAFVHTLSIIEYYLVHTALNAHDGYIDMPVACARMIELSFIPRMIDELFTEPYRHPDVWGAYATTYRHVLRFLNGYNELFPGYVRANRWDFTFSCGIGMYLRGEGEIEWKASGTSRGPSFLEVIQAFWTPGDPISGDIQTLYNALTSTP